MKIVAENFLFLEYFSYLCKVIKGIYEITHN